MTQWREDVLGEGFSCSDIDLGVDDEGPVTATLVRALPEARTLWHKLTRSHLPLEDVDVLYVHGWSDYFFQRDLAHFWTDRGARFFALDLRKYGRSLRPEHTPGYVEDLKEYDLEIDRALEIMETASRGRRLILFGHSTGGLVLSLWAHRHPGRADAVILNSPWLELQVSGPARGALAAVVNLRARFQPHDIALPQLDLGFYHRAQLEVAVGGEADEIDAVWRPEQADPVRSGWLRAVLDGHHAVARGLDITAPVCVLLSSRSHFGLSWRDEMTRADTVLEVEGISRAALRLGTSVTVERIPGALHDVFLSHPDARAAAYQRLAQWISGWNVAHRTRPVLEPSEPAETTPALL